MKKLVLPLVSLFVLSSIAVFGQKKKDDKSSTTVRDVQTQMEFFKPFYDSKDYNVKDRKRFKTPLQPSYDFDSSVYQKTTKKKADQQDAYLQNKYYYPSRPRDKWELGLTGGSFMISGDIAPNYLKSWGVGLSVRKALNYYISVRFGYIYGDARSNDWLPRQNAQFDQAVNGSNDPRVNYYTGVYQNGGVVVQNLPLKDILFHNYRTQTHNVHLEAVLNVGNLLFHKERTKFNFNIFGGIGFHFFQVRMNMLDANGRMYDFSNANNIYNQMKSEGAKKGETQKAVRSELNSIYDKTWETQGEVGRTGWQTRVGRYNFEPNLQAGFSIGYHMTKWVTLQLEERMIFNHNDVLDGVQWQEDVHNGFTPEYDQIHYTSLQLLFHLGNKKSVEPLYWLNPMHQTYQKLADVNPDKIAADILQDTDEDGVPDKLDKEPNTKKGCPVDVKGVALDSDKDGLADCDDKEPFSPAGCPIDQYGVANCPPPACCAEKKEDPNANKKGYDCSKVELPGAFFDNDKYYVSPEYYGNLHQVAEKLQMCPDTKLIVTGYDESSSDQKYNEQLAYNRATSVVDYMNEKYGISRDRFIVGYQGGKKSNKSMTDLERRKTRRVDFGYAADGQTGSSNPPAPHPGLKAGSNK